MVAAVRYGDNVRIDFPLDGASQLDDGTRISLPYLLPDTGGVPGRFARPDAHFAYEGTLYLGGLEDKPFTGARWIIRTPLSQRPGS